MTFEGDCLFHHCLDKYIKKTTGVRSTLPPQKKKAHASVGRPPTSDPRKNSSYPSQASSSKSETNFHQKMWLCKQVKSDFKPPSQWWSISICKSRWVSVSLFGKASSLHQVCPGRRGTQTYKWQIVHRHFWMLQDFSPRGRSTILHLDFWHPDSKGQWPIRLGHPCHLKSLKVSFSQSLASNLENLFARCEIRRFQLGKYSLGRIVFPPVLSRSASGFEYHQMANLNLTVLFFSFLLSPLCEGSLNLCLIL